MSRTVLSHQAAVVPEFRAWLRKLIAVVKLLLRLFLEIEVDRHRRHDERVDFRYAVVKQPLPILALSALTAC